jgi:hypothetical protein
MRPLAQGIAGRRLGFVGLHGVFALIPRFKIRNSGGVQPLATVAKSAILTQPRNRSSIDAVADLRGMVARTIGRTQGPIFMFRKIWKSALALGTVASLAPVVSFAYSNPCAAAVPCQTQAMPEGGSAAAYLVAAGAICVGALLLGKRLRKTRVS